MRPQMSKPKFVLTEDLIKVEPEPTTYTSELLLKIDIKKQYFR
jgi:hypothetical protein